MGTSGPYTPSPNWAGLKTEITNALNAGPVKDQDAHDLVRDFVDKLLDEKDEGIGDVPKDFGGLTPDGADQKLQDLLKTYPLAPTRSRSTGGGAGGSGGGSSGGAAGRPRSGGGGGSGGGQSARRSRLTTSGSVRPVAQRLATFISEVPKVGLRQALINSGITNVDQLPPDQIAMAIADVLAVDSSSIVQTEMRDALVTVLEKVCENPSNLEGAEEQIITSSQDLQTVVQMLFECYIVERFKTFFSEHEAAKHGYEAADKIVNEAREYVASEMQLEKAERHDLTGVYWGNEEGAKIVDAILERTIAIYTE